MLGPSLVGVAFTDISSGSRTRKQAVCCFNAISQTWRLCGRMVEIESPRATCACAERLISPLEQGRACSLCKYTLYSGKIQANLTDITVIPSFLGRPASRYGGVCAYDSVTSCLFA